jgi:hypothetical protein
MCEVTVGIISYNRLNILINILDKLSKQTIPCKVIICDDGSKNILNPNDYPIITKYLWNKDNGYTRVERMNQIMNECDTEFLIYLDDDCIPQNNNFIESYLLNLKNNDVVRGITFFHWGGDASSWFSCCNIGFKLNKLKEIGGFDKNYNGHYGEEYRDMGKMVEKNNYKIALFPHGTNVLHVGNMYANGDRSEKIIGHNQKYFKEKWYLKVAVLCSNFGDYDYIYSNPKLIDKNKFDWYLFTDNKNEKSTFWNIINQEFHFENKIDGKNNFLNKELTPKVKNMMIAKYYKLQSHNIKIIKDNNYTHVVWIDSSISILNNNFVNDLIDIINKDEIELVNFYHPERNNIYTEADLSIKMDKYECQDIPSQIKKYKEEGFSENNLFWCGFFCRKLNEKINKIFDDWWNENIKMSFQDQISFPYVLWKNNKYPDYIIRQSMYNNNFLGKINYPHKAHIK